MVYTKVQPNQGTKDFWLSSWIIKMLCIPLLLSVAGFDVGLEQLLFCAITHRSDQLLYSALFYDIDFFFATQGMFLGQVFLGGDS